MNRDALVTVVIPVFNREHTLGRAIESVIEQTHQNWELFVVNDGSRDNSLSIAEGYANSDSRISIVKLEENRGATAARNAGATKGNGEWIAFNDSDDRWDPRKLELQLTRAQEWEQANGKSPSVLYSGINIVFPDGGSHPFTRGAEGDVQVALAQQFFAPTQTLLIKREDFERVGGFDETLRCGDEYDLTLRISTEGHFAKIEDPLVDVYHSTTGRRNEALAVYEMLTRHGSRFINARGRSGYSALTTRAFLAIEKRKYAKEARWLLLEGLRTAPICVARTLAHHLVAKFGSEPQGLRVGI